MVTPHSANSNQSMNYAEESSVQIKASVAKPTGSGASEPDILLRNPPLESLNGEPLEAFSNPAITFDTYDGQNSANGLDWYQVEFPEPIEANCVEMTMGFPCRDGGWWTSLSVEFRDITDGTWLSVRDLVISPDYNFSDHRGERRPFETFALTFVDVRTNAIRIVGRPGGLAEFTSLAKLAVFRRVRSEALSRRLNSPKPFLFKLIEPNTIWDISESLVKLTGLTVEIPTLEYYLDEGRYKRYWDTLGTLYQGVPDLWFLLGNSFGWKAWQRLLSDSKTSAMVEQDKPHLEVGFNNLMARAVAPIMIKGSVVGTLTTRYALLNDRELNWHWHQEFARTHMISWADYQQAIEHSPRVSRMQLEGMADLMGMITNTIANLSHYKQNVEHELNELRKFKSASAQSTYIVQQAMHYMQDKLESDVTVAEVARHVALSPAYFCTLFSTEVGRTPSEFLIGLRVARAKEYLTHSDMTVLEVSTALGYSASYFSRLFKRHTGHTPGDYAQRTRVSAHSEA